MSEVLRIRERSDDEKPREKMIKKGVKSLSDAELLAIMIRTGDKNNNAVTLSSKVLTLSKDGVRGLTDLSLDELCSIDGIGPSKATIIKAALELGIRVSQYQSCLYNSGLGWSNPINTAEFIQTQVGQAPDPIFG